jgi:Fic family protein
MSDASAFIPGPASSRHAWPLTEYEEIAWEPSDSELSYERSASKAGTYRAAIPPFIARADVAISAEIAALAEDARAEAQRFDGENGEVVAPFASLLLRSESVASSRIENLTANARSILQAELGDTSKSNARQIVGNTRAMQAALSLATSIDTLSILAMHEALLADHDPAIAGKLRTEPVWIGAQNTPVTADFVGPEYSRIPELLDDLCDYANRTDVPVLAHIALAHAQFETIHPFEDGNGRTGRALVQSMLRNSGVTRSVTVPISAGILTEPDAYYAALTSYRAGLTEPIIRLFAESTFRSVRNGRTLVSDVSAITSAWRMRIDSRSDSAVWRLLDHIARNPVFTADSAAKDLGIAVTNMYRQIEKLESEGIVKASRHLAVIQWRSDEILSALDSFAARAGRRAAQ